MKDKQKLKFKNKDWIEALSYLQSNVPLEEKMHFLQKQEELMKII